MQAPRQGGSFKLKAFGSGSQLVIDYPETMDVFELVTCTQEVPYVYSTATLRACHMALRSSFKTSLKFNEKGVLAMQVSLEFRCSTDARYI